tara:strand:+ start:3601 stop:3765 length:165 start_codon:yes stop_codon:yes gene_type:complete
MLWHKRGRKKENDMAKGLGKEVVKTAVGLALLGVTIFVVGFGFKRGQEAASKKK